MSGSGTGRRRGEPLIVLALIGTAWIAARVVLWDAPPGSNPAAARVASAPAVPADLSARIAPQPSPPVSMEELRDAAKIDRIPDAHSPLALQPLREPDLASAGPRPSGPGAIPPISRPAAPFATVARQERAAPSPASVPIGVAGKARRWHVDGWIAWRPGSGQPRIAAGASPALAYGGTQAGIVARLDLGDGSRRPQAYLRAVHAPDKPSQSDLAVGLGLRPLARFPVRVQGEARLTRTAGQTFARPAIAAVSELAPRDLPLGLRAEAYGQAGWVGGRHATGFVDGQVRIDRALASVGKARVRFGAGAWGGAQKFAGRLDVGPTATLDLRPAGVPARLSVDYRLKVAGNARPGNGVAVTLSTGL